MADQIVSVVDQDEAPGLGDLLAEMSSDANLERIAQAAANEIEPALDGIRVIGELLWRSAHPEACELDKGTQHRLGVVLVHLADYADRMNVIYSNARFGQRRAAGGDA